MALSKEMRLLLNKWETGQHWPKRLEALELHGYVGGPDSESTSDFRSLLWWVRTALVRALCYRPLLPFIDSRSMQQRRFASRHTIFLKLHGRRFHRRR